MINEHISRAFNEALHPIKCVKDEMEKEAIKDDGIYSTFKFYNHWLPAQDLTKAKLWYCKLDCDDKWLPAQRKIFYKDCPELGEFTTLPCICSEALQKAADRIKMDVVKKDDALWSTIKVEPFYDHFWVTYDKANNLEAKEDQHLTTSRYLRASDLEIENTKRALRRIQENSYYGLYPRRSGLTYDFDKKLKEDIKASLKTWKAKAEAIEKEGRWKSWEPTLKYAESDAKAVEETYKFMHKKEEKEKKDMNITLMVVPEGMNKDFVRKVKANYQSNNSLRLFIASTDIDYSCEHEPIKTKYDLFEKWIKTGYVDVVYFMLGFEKDPDVRAFEAFVRGITEFSGKVDVRVAYQRDDILNDANSLRTRYFDEADAKEDLEKAGNKVVKEAKTMQDIYGLDDEGLEAIKYSKGRIEVSEGLIMDKIMDVAFAEDGDAKPKKGGKK